MASAHSVEDDSPFTSMKMTRDGDGGVKIDAGTVAYADAMAGIYMEAA
ncbi:MAG: hypothetical protein ABFD64_07535 [Armatimonadota bacterium]